MWKILNKFFNKFCCKMFIFLVRLLKIICCRIFCENLEYFILLIVINICYVVLVRSFLCFFVCLEIELVLLVGKCKLNFWVIVSGELFIECYFYLFLDYKKYVFCWLGLLSFVK